MTVADASSFLSVSRRQVYLLVERGELPAVRVGQRLRFLPDEVQDYLEQHREVPAP
jgi:excisionase family DNA binding protein